MIYKAPTYKPPTHKPMVYVGPSLPAAEVPALLPGAEVRPPVRRGDLHRDREAGVSVFVILDGVFAQHLAISPREILDLLEDGALIFGAASMGALRAAECWPAGMRGIGTIYRLFRQGRLHSDDEVAVTFDLDQSYQTLSVPLINVRFALRRAVRGGRLSAAEGDRIAGVAQSIFYPERTWETILSLAGLNDAGDLRTFLTGHDLKRTDARRALDRVARHLAAEPRGAERPRRGSKPFRRSELSPQQGTEPGLTSDEETRRQLARWHLASGRYLRHLPAIAAAHPQLGLSKRLQAQRLSASLLSEGLSKDPATGSDRPTASQREDALHSAALELALFELWRDLTDDIDLFSGPLWATLVLSGDLTAELHQWRAVRDAAVELRRRGLMVEESDRHLAEMELTQAHGFPAWQSLKNAAGGMPPWLATVRDQLAAGGRLRRHLFP